MALHEVCHICAGMKGPRHNCMKTSNLKWISVVIENKVQFLVLGVIVEPPIDFKINVSTQTDQEQ